MSLDKKIVAKRLKLWGKENYPSNEKFAEALEITTGVLQSSYLNGRSLPGAKIIAILDKLGCQISWLLSDEPEIELQIVKEKAIAYNNKEPLLQKRIKELEDQRAILLRAVSLISQLYELQSDDKDISHNDISLLLNKLNIDEFSPEVPTFKKIDKISQSTKKDSTRNK